MRISNSIFRERTFINWILKIDLQQKAAKDLYSRLGIIQWRWYWSKVQIRMRILNWYLMRQSLLIEVFNGVSTAYCLPLRIKQLSPKNWKLPFYFPINWFCSGSLEVLRVGAIVSKLPRAPIHSPWEISPRKDFPHLYLLLIQSIEKKYWCQRVSKLLNRYPMSLLPH